MRTASSPYEVRCPNCDVSFPIETRNCIHCGGATSSVPQIANADTGEWQGVDAYDSHRTADPFAGTAAAMPSNGPAREDSDALFRLPEFGSDDSDALESDEPNSIGRSLVRRLGGFVWIIVLIGFTLVRTCRGE